MSFISNNQANVYFERAAALEQQGLPGEAARYRTMGETTLAAAAHLAAIQDTPVDVFLMEPASGTLDTSSFPFKIVEASVE